MNETRYWVIVACKDHVQNGVRAGAAQANHGKSTSLRRMKPGDGILYYSPKVTFDGNEKLQVFTAIGSVADDKIYQFDMGGGFVPYRCNINYFECIEAPIQQLIPALTFIQNKKSWGYLFRFGFFEIPKVDFDLIASHMLAERIADA